MGSKRNQFDYIDTFANGDTALVAEFLATARALLEVASALSAQGIGDESYRKFVAGSPDNGR